jgi:hypothetical protein
MLLNTLAYCAQRQRWSCNFRSRRIGSRREIFYRGAETCKKPTSYNIQKSCQGNCEFKTTKNVWILLFTRHKIVATTCGRFFWNFERSTALLFKYFSPHPIVNLLLREGQNREILKHRSSGKGMKEKSHWSNFLSQFYKRKIWMN